MFGVTEAQLLAWITPLAWPFIRTLAMFTAMPVFSQRNMPMRVRIALAGLTAYAAQASMPDMPLVALDSPPALMLVLQQLLIGTSLGFAVRVVFTSLEFAGELIGLQMGLNYAGFFDPATGGQGTAVSRFFGTLTALLFVVGNGHLLLINAVVQSFQTFPVGAEPFAFLRIAHPQVWGAEIFRIGLWVALPLITMLLFVNLVLGIISRVASQINIYAVGFPITISIGLVGLLMTLPLMQMPFTLALEKMLANF